ncbi:MAG: phage antirepressor KilAC domain-containing protein [Amphritea sp.]|nr:phage antirepressor KilAC domain-containing protein [Amphritea sp.]
MRNLCIDMKEAAQLTNIKGGRQALMALLRKHGHITKSPCGRSHTASHRLIQIGLLRNQLRQARTGSGVPRNYYKVVVTEKGISWLTGFVKQYGELKEQKAA